jgi:hypothetical protein
MLVILVFLKIPDQPTTQAPSSEKLKQLDTPGTILLVLGTVRLLLALQWWGQTYLVSQPTPVVLFIKNF